MRRLDIAVDFDGTIVQAAWPEIGKAKWGAKWVLNWAARRGHTLILWTCREGENLGNAKCWLMHEGIWGFRYFNESPPHLIELFKNDSRKIGFDIQIDDKASYIFWPYQYLRIMWKAWRVNHG